VASAIPTSHPMPRAAVDAALDTFALVMRERHPGVIALPLGQVGADGSVVSSPAGQIIRPFATPGDRDAILDRDACVGAPDDHRVDRARSARPRLPC
jgi:hypothetical protein